MIIIDDTQSTRGFFEVPVGAVFKKEYEGAKPDYCMKIRKILDQPSQEQYNAINLEDGSLQFFADYEEIVPYDATVHLDL